MILSYRKEKVIFLQPKEGYNKVSTIYNKYHSKLDTWDNWLFKKFLPRDLAWLNIIDIGAWDWRLTKYFENKKINRYVACDISEKLLSRNKGWVEKKLMDLEVIPYDFQDEEFDVALSFFVLLHINNIQWLFDEVYRILKKWWRFVVLHHIERRPFEYVINGENFKISSYTHRYDQLEQIASNSFFQIDSEDILENNILVWKIYCFTKE